MLIPTVKWAQRPNVVYLTIDVQDTKDPEIELDNTEDGANGHLVFKAKASGADEDAMYQLDLVMYAAVDKEKSKISVSPRNIFLVLEKKESGSWPRLTKESGKHLTHIKVDWDKWVDSDDEEDDKFDPNAMGDLSSLAGMGGMGGMGGFPGMGGMGGMGGLGAMGGMGGLGGMAGMAGLEGMAGMAGLEGMDFGALGADAAGAGDTAGADDSDDEDLPELEA